MQGANLPLQVIGSNVASLRLGERRLFDFEDVLLPFRFSRFEEAEPVLGGSLGALRPRGGELGLEELLAEGTNLAEGRVDVASSVGGVGGPGVLLEVGELEFSSVGSLRGILHCGVRVREELLAPRGTLAKVVERAFPLLGIRGVDAPRERSLRAGECSLLRLQQVPGVFAQAEQPGVLHLQPPVEPEAVAVQPVSLRLRNLLLVLELRG